MTQAQESHNEARRKDAEEAVETLYNVIEMDPLPNELKALEFLAWEAGVLDFFKKLRSE